MIRLLFVGKRGEADFADAVDRYAERTNRFVRTEVVYVRPEPPGAKPESRRILAAEARRVETELHARDFLVACDEKGPQRTSEAFAAELRRWLDSSPHAVVFLVGGAFGIDPALTSKARAILPLSRLTLPHQLARVILTEQVYRAVATLAGVAYSK